MKMKRTFELRIKFKSNSLWEITANLGEIAIPLDRVIEHRALHQECIISFKDALDSIVVGRDKNRRLLALQSGTLIFLSSYQKRTEKSQLNSLPWTSTSSDKFLFLNPARKHTKCERKRIQCSGWEFDDINMYNKVSCMCRLKNVW